MHSLLHFVFTETVGCKTNEISMEVTFAFFHHFENDECKSYLIEISAAFTVLHIFQLSVMKVKAECVHNTTQVGNHFGCSFDCIFHIVGHNILNGLLEGRW
eukprot:NODE_1485_length_442_cov_128.431746_g1475_i0.p1 GENE.NODE_1485_length_442_cov_128.431746_g1475_i0~~NODE_1485_length_442_cov_128.431746_g1475_i0.p1  ORF type:complete len:101 (+),score=7.24 NODE_1485_length_442_cov_128.431746_g1475_i0:56-358(+)